MSPPASTLPDGELSRWGLLALPVAGIALGVSFTASTTLPESDADINRFIDGTLGPAGIAYGALGIIGLIALLLGILAIYIPLRGSRWATIGLVFSTVSIGLLIAASGTTILGEQVLAGLYRAGQQGVFYAFFRFWGNYSSGYVAAYTIAATAVGLVGTIANVCALVRVRGASIRTALVFGLGYTFVLASFPLVTPFGGLLLAIAAGWLIHGD